MSRVKIALGIICILAISSISCTNANISNEGIDFVKALPIEQELQDQFIQHYDEIRDWLLTTTLSQPQAGRASVDCLACRIVMSITFTIMRSPIPKEAILQLFQGLGCIVLDLVRSMHPDVCKGALELFIDDVHFIIRNHEALRPLDFCAILLGRDGNCPDIREEFTSWNVSIKANKPPLQSIPYLPANTPSVKILHLTDIHLDLDYSEGKNTQCGKPMCCQEWEDDGLTPETRAGPHGDYRCDIPLHAMNELFEHSATLQGYDYEFVLMTGDIPPHNVWNTSIQGNLQHFSLTNSKLLQLFSEERSVPIYPVLGNHEPHPCNLFPPESVWGIDTFDKSWMYNAFADAYSTQIRDPDALAQFRKTGYYTTKHKDTNLRIVVINSNFCNTMNFWLYYELNDPQGQLQWLSNVLALAEENKERVYIAGHIPPGKGCWGKWSSVFETIVLRFESTIMAQFYGHTHNDETTIFYDSFVRPPRPANSLFIGASTTALTDINPGYKVFFADGLSGESTWEIMDHETWIYNLTQANLAGSANMPWRRLYVAKEAFGLRSMRPGDLDDLVYRMLFDEELFQKYWQYYNKDSHVKSKCTTDPCKLNYICEMVIANSEDYSHCDRFKEYFLQGPTTTLKIETSTSSAPGFGFTAMSIFISVSTLLNQCITV